MMDERYNDCLSASLSSCAFTSQNAYRDNNEDPFHQFETTLEMVATIKVPQKMAEGVSTGPAATISAAKRRSSDCLMTDRCPWCGQPARMEFAGGHYECGSCCRLVMDCCGGE